MLAALNEQGEIIDFGAVEVQAVYISGNVKNAFKKYMENPSANYPMDWPKKNYPSPDYLSSSRKRLAPQLIYKGGILHTWKKKMAVVVDESFFSQLPKLKTTSQSKADIAWMVYGLQFDKTQNRYILERRKVIYTLFESALATITTPVIGEVGNFVNYLQIRINKGKAIEPPSPSQLSPDVEPMPNFIDSEQ